MLGELTAHKNDQGHIEYKGHVRSYLIDLDFKLDAIEKRKDEKSPTHNIVARGKHGKGFFAGVAWQGQHAEYGRFFSLSLEVPELFDGVQAMIAGETASGSGIYTIRHSKDKKEAA